MSSEHIIDYVHNFRRESDYDGYNDYYVNPEWQRPQTLRLKEANLHDDDNDLIPDIL